MSKIMSLKVTAEDHEGKLSAWKREVSIYTRASGSPLPEVTDVAILMSNMQRKLKQHLLFTYIPSMTYAQLRSAILNFAKSSHTMNAMGSAPMDIGTSAEYEEYWNP